MHRERPIRHDHILIAVDESENARRALQYVADLIGGLKGFHVTLLSILTEPADEYLVSDMDRHEWIQKHHAHIIALLDEYRGILLRTGWNEDQVTVRVEAKEGFSFAECIIGQQKKLGCGTIVIGRRGISKKAELVLGSTSNTILHTAKDCAVWVIE